MTIEDLIKLKKKLDKSVKAAENKLIAEHKKHFPNSPYNSTKPSDIGCEYQQNLQIMYINLSNHLNK